MPSGMTTPEDVRRLPARVDAVLIGTALVQLFILPLRTTVGQSLFRLAVVDDKGQLARPLLLLARWAIAWLPLFAALTIAALLAGSAESAAVIFLLASLIVWLGAAVCSVVHPHQGLHDRLAGTWVVRR